MDSYTRLRQLLSGYVNTYREPDTTELQQCLQAVTSEQRYELVTEVRDGLGTATHIGALLDHTETISCILDSFTAEVRYKVLKVQLSGITAIHRAAVNGHAQAMRCMLDKVSPEHQIQLLNTRTGANKTSLDIALSLNQPETATLIRQYIETAKKNIKEKQERKQDLNNADSQRGLKREIADFKEEVLRLRAKLEEQEVLNQQKDQQIEALQQKMDEIIGKVCQVERKTQEQEVGVQKAAEKLPALAATTEVHGVQLQQHDVKISALQQQGNGMKTNMVELKGEISQVKQQTQEQQVNVQDAAAKIPVLTATTEGHEVQLQQHDVKISALQQKMDEITEKFWQMEQSTQEQEVGVQRAAEELPALAATTEVHGVHLQQHDVKITTLQQQGNEMKTEMVEMKGEISQVKQQTQEQKVNVQDAAEKIPVLTATTEGHGVQLQQHDVKISALQLQGVEQNTQIKANTEGISKNRDDMLQQESLFQKKADQTTEQPEDCCINPEQEVERPPTPTGEEVEEEYIDRGIQVIDN